MKEKGITAVDGKITAPRTVENNGKSSPTPAPDVELWDIYDRERRKTGRLVERGRPMRQDEYHLVVHVWIKNQSGEWLISKRTPNKTHPNMWEATGGSAVAGEDSLSAAMREAKEELGVELTPERGRRFKSFVDQRHDFPQFTDVWIFEHDCPIDDIVFQEGETCDAMWASAEKIREMLARGLFLGYDVFPYLDELL